MQVLVAQIGARRHFAVPRGLAKHGRLERLVTNLCANHPIVGLAKLIPPRLRPNAIRRILERKPVGIDAAKVSSSLMFELRNLKRPKTTSQQYRSYVAKNRQFCKYVLRSGFGQADVVYGFNTASLELFRVARQHGLRCVVDQTMAPFAVVESLLAEERQRWPQWEQSQVSEQDWMRLAERERQEWELADAIICGSQFVADSVSADCSQFGGPAEISGRCRVAPYGVFESKAATPAKGIHKKPRVLCVGSVELRKGIPYLLEAAKELKKEGFQFRVVGPLHVSVAAQRQLREHLELVGPTPRGDVPVHYQWADFFVLPTVAEGSANVCYEAISHGLPVITTPHAGAVIRDGVEGYIVPIRSSSAIVDRVTRLAGDQKLREEMTANAKMLAADFSLEKYGARLLAAIGDNCPKRVGPQAPQDMAFPAISNL